MPAFEYKALDNGGKTKKGVISADSERAARFLLRERSLTPIELAAPKQVKSNDVLNRGPKKIGSGDLVLLSRQLAALLGAATPLEEALHAVALQSDKPIVRTRMMAVRERVIEGWRFADALGEDQKSFSALYRSIVSAGEASGDLGSVMDRLATMLEKNQSMKNKAIGALVYPAALGLVATGVVVALMVFVVPKIVDQFSSFNAQLPFVTRVVVGASDFLAGYGLWLLVALAIMAAGWWRALQVPAFRLIVDRSVLKLPIIGRLMRAVDGARFARTLATLFAGGSPLLDSLRGAQRTMTNSYMRDRLDRTVTMVSEGASLAAGIARADVLPPMLMHMVGAGERAGALPTMLEKAAVQLEEEFDTASTVALRMLEPSIIVGMGGAVALIVLAIMLPVLKLNALAGAG